jgi:hypothetical protein
MARLKKEQRPELIKGGYSAIPWVVLDSQSFKGASDKAKSLLFALMRQHNGSNNGHLHLAKKWLYKQGWTCDANNRKACHELMERGLVVSTKLGGLNMGPNLYALTWYDITNYVGLDVNAKSYQRGAYALCNLPPTARRKPPTTTKKQVGRHNYRDSSASATELVEVLSSAVTELIKPVFETITVTTTENNVITPLPSVKSVNRIIGVKGRSGISKVSFQYSLVNKVGNHDLNLITNNYAKVS